MKAVLYALLFLWLIQVARIVGWLIGSRVPLSRLSPQVRQNCVRFTRRPWPADLHPADLEFAEQFKKRFFRDFYMLVGLPMMIASCAMVAYAILDFGP